METVEQHAKRRAFSEACSDVGGGVLMACVGFAFLYATVKLTPVLVVALCDYLGVSLSAL